MAECAVLWLGTPRPPAAWARRLAAAGQPIVEIVDQDDIGLLLRALRPQLALLAPGVAMPEGLLAAATPADEPPPRVVAVVETRRQALDALARGATDALPLDTADDEVALRVTAWLRVAERDRRQSGAIAVVAERLREAEERLRETEAERDKLRELAHRDELTGLGNRRSFHSHLEFAVSWAARYGGPVAAVVCDLDGMKQLNDRFGHPAGDAALRTVAQILRASLRNVDHAARLGGDEFGLIMPHTRADSAALVAERIRAKIAEVALPGQLALSASFGVASQIAPRGVGFAADELVARADQALYVAKRDGKNRVAIDEASKKAEQSAA
jgi:diguanylate cyclase (GGDEF)-like protein